MNTKIAQAALAILLLIGAVFAFDRVIPAHVSASVLYVVPIMLTILTGSSRLLAAITALTIILTAVDFFLTTEQNLEHLWSDELLSLLVQITTASLVWKRLRAGKRERAAYEQAEAERQKLALIHRVASSTSNTLDLDYMLKSITEQMAGLFDADVVAIWLADESGSELIPAYSNSDSYLAVTEKFKSVEWQSSQMTMAQAARRREVVIAGANHQTPTESQEIMRMIGASMGMAVPLFVRDRLVGVMTLAFGSEREINKQDIALVQTVGSQIAIAIENAKLFGNVSRQREQLELINEIGRVFASTLDLQTIYVSIRERLREIVDCDTMLVSLYDGDSETITCGFAYTDGEVMPTDAFEPLKLGSGPHSECIRKARPLIVDNIRRQHTGSFRYVGHTDNHPLSIIHVPMISEERVIGVIQAQSLRESAYSEADIPLLSIIANQAAISIQNARLYHDALEGRRALERANQIKDEFLAMLSHELRTPLTPILGWTRILGRLSPTDHETRNHALEVIERNTRLQAQLVNDLLDLSRIGSGKVAINLQPLDLNRAAQVAIESISAEAESRDIRIEARLASPGAIVMADQARIEQIINNLLTNAIKFSDDNGRVIVSTEITGGHCALTVSDNGIGIANDFLPHVFDKFRQADSSTRRRHSGLGLGLSIVKSLVEMHGGDVSANSEGVGLGATFTVRFPLAASKDVVGQQVRQDERVPQTAQAYDPLPEIRLLVIEDDADTLEMMRILCEAQNIQVTGVQTAEEAFRLLNGYRPDLIISDIKLPGMDGHELARRLRTDARLNSLPMIAITGFVSDDDRSIALDAGFDAHLSKPINYGEMFNLIRRLTRQPVASGG